MKKLILFLFTFFIVSSVAAFVSFTSLKNLVSNRISQSENKVLPAETQSTDPYKNLKTITFEGKTYAYDYIIVKDTEVITLIPNYVQNLSSEEIRSSSKCSFLTDAGFYTKENSPVGLVISSYSEVSKQKDSLLFNGFFSINSFDTPLITQTPQEIPPRISLQTGPLLIVNSFIEKLSIKNDEYVRRVVAAVNGDNQVLFMVFFDPNSVFLGPKLSNLPIIVKSVSDATGLNIADAINLDGGSASVFYSKNLNLKELTNVGSFFCIK